VSTPAPITPEQRRTAVRMFLRAIDQQEWGVIEALMHPKVDYEVTGFIPFRGRDAVMNYYRNLRAVVKSEHLIESMLVDGESTVTWGRFNGKYKDGTDISVLFADVMVFDDRKITKRRVYYCEPKLAAP
jgi:ketosteroid isomerase-like protein